MVPIKLSESDVKYIKALRQYLEEYQCWRRGSYTQMDSPVICGMVLDNVIELLRQIPKGGFILNDDIVRY